MLFFSTFIENIQNKSIINDSIDKKYYNVYFRNFLLNYFNVNFKNNNQYDIQEINNNNNKLIEIISNYLITYLNKPQRLLKDNSDYYIAIDMITNTKYICFKDFCILDFDINKNNFSSKEEILNYIDNNDILNKLIYYRVETERGYHIYLLDKPREYSDLNTFYFLNNFDSDVYYKFYCYLRGFSIRLSFKDSDNYIYKCIKLVNKCNLKPNIKLKNLFHIHLRYFDKK